MLPKLPNKDQIKKAQTIQFSGINRNPGAVDGTIWDTTNMGSDRMPCLSPRKRRYYIGQYSKCSGIFAHNGLYMVNDKTVYKDGVSVGEAKTNDDKFFAMFNDAVTNSDYLLMWPDKQSVNVVNDGEASWNPGVEIDNIPIQFRDAPSADRLILDVSKVSLDDFKFTECGIYPGDTITVVFTNQPINTRTAEVKAIKPVYIDFPKGTWRNVSDGAKYYVTVKKGQPDTVTLLNVKVEEIAPDFILSSRTNWSDTAFKAGDEVTISGSSIPGNNKSAVISSVSHGYLYFPSDTFTLAHDQTITISKSHTTPVDRVSDMEITVSPTDAQFKDYDEDSKGNVIYSENTNWTNEGFRVGDAVRITRPGYTYEPMIIRDIYGPDHYLRFDENVFVLTPSGTESITVKRSIPDLDGAFEHEQRIWGWKGSTIYASKWNDPLNWEVFDGLESDSWSWTMDGAGDIAGGIVYQGYPTFFKEDKVVRIYGDRPSQYRVMEVSAMGVHPGCGKSLAIAGDTLYYVSRNGLAAFSGGYSRDIHTEFGELRFTQAVAGSDGRRYFLSAYDAQEGWALYVYDTVFGTWFREGLDHMTYFTCDRGNLYWLKGDAYKYIELDGHAPTPPPYAAMEEAITSEVEFNSFTGNYWTSGRGYGNPSRKGTSKIQLRVTLEAGSYLAVSMLFEGGGESDEIPVKRLDAGDGMHSYYLPIIPRRSDNYKIILRGYGDWTLNSLVREEYSGSDIH
jgi:hypothetical protein